MKNFIPQKITSEQAKDTGMAATLISLLIALFNGQQYFYNLAILILLINMIWSNLYVPMAKIWLGLSNIMGFVMSRIVLSIIFLFFVLPVGYIRRLFGKDPLNLKKWKKGHSSVFRIREHEFAPEDVNHPY